MTRARVARLTLAVVSISLCGRAAAEHPPVQLQLDACVSDRDEVRRIVAIELGALLAAPADPTARRTRATVDCRGAILNLRVDDPITGKSIARTVNPTDSPARAQPRLLALAIVELVTASWNELEANAPRVEPAPPAAVTRAEPAPPAIVARAAPEPTALSRLRLVAVGGGMSFFSRPTFLGGAGLRLGRDHARHVGWMVDVQAHHGANDFPLGAISADTVTVGTAFILHYSWRRIGLRLGAGLRGGAVRLSGTPKDPQTVKGGTLWGPWGGPLALAGVSLAATRRLALELTVESGYVVSPVGGLVGGVRQVAIDGPWIGFQLGIGVFL